MMIFKFEPIYKERVWGGTKIRDLFGRETPEGSLIGESWEIVDRKDDNSVLANTSHRGLTLAALLKSDGKSVMGPNWEPGRPFPLLVKWLDCSKRLSLQVHPPGKIAKKLSGEPKTENWYVAEASSDAGLFIGLKKGTSPDDFGQAVEEKTVEALCHRVQSKKGDSILVESGRLHAIDAGNLILEIQQNSDTTYRVYDWGRLGLDG
ncbi:MAG: type I phosphomannose isomerase catalytic subunit, partial [Opitutae bacterium]